MQSSAERSRPRPPAPLASYAGTYRTDFWGPATVTQRDGRLELTLSVVRAGADAQALAVLGELDQPFPVTAARTALGTSRRVALALLAHLDKGGRTVRLADDTRRLRT